MSGDAYFWTLSALLQGFAALMAKGETTEIVGVGPEQR